MPLHIDIVADFVCPWCFIGKRRLEKAAAMVRESRPDLVYTTRWQPFFLNPDTPPAGEPYLPFLEKKFGGPQAVAALFAQVRQAGAAYGIDYAFEKIRLRANTLQAHRLVHWAQGRGSGEADKVDALVERLFVAQFQRGEALGDPAILTAIATECGYPASAVAAYLASAEDEAEVRDAERHWRARGIRMVPTFIVNGQEVVVGAEDPAVLAGAMLRDL